MTTLSPEAAAELGGPEWLRTERAQAAARFAATPLPTSALEEWRYSRIDALDLGRYDYRPELPGSGEQPGSTVPTDDQVQEMIAAAGPGTTVVQTVDGWLADISGNESLVSRFADLGQAPAGLDSDTDALATANRAFAPDPLLVRVGPGVGAATVVVVHWCRADEAVLFPRLRVEAAADREITVLEVVAGPAASLVVPVTEIDVAPAARVSYLHLQLLGDDAWQLALQASRVGADASLTSAAVALGGDYARLRTDSALVGPGGSSRLVALYFGAGGQMHDFRTVQDHRAPKTTSELLYKGVVANTARSVYSGLIRVEKGARGSNAFQTNRNLVLHEGAHADSVPNLEIEDNDVRCSHASAVGPVSEEQRFYLESRGVPTSVTDRLIALGFLGEVIDQLPIAGLAPRLTRSVAAKLASAEAYEEPRS